MVLDKKCKLEVYELVPKGIGGFLQSIKSYNFVLALQNQTSGAVEIYSKDKCEFEPGFYNTIVLDPYNGGRIGNGIVKLSNECTYIVISYSNIAGSAYTQAFQSENEFMKYAKKAKLQRPSGFETANVERLVNDLLKYGYL